MSVSHKFISLAIGAGCLFIVSCQSGDHAEKRDKPRKVVLPAGEVHEGWYFAAGDQVMILGTINGDLYAGAGTVEVNGVVNGDVIVAGGDVSIGGTVSDDVRAAGGSVRIDGKVGKSVTAAGGNVRVGSSGVVGGSLLAAGGNVQVSGKIGHDARVGAGNVDITGTIDGTLDVASEALAVLAGASIGRDLNVYTGKEDNASIAPGAVKGKVNIVLEKEQSGERLLGFKPFSFWWKFFWVGSLLATLLMLVFLAPQQLLGVGGAIVDKPGLSALWGVVGLIGIPLGILILCITVIGIPIGMLVLALYLWILYLSQLSLGILLGKLLFKADQKSGWTLFGWLALGVIIVQVFTLIPYVKFLVNLAGVVFGLGGILLVLRGTFQAKGLAAKSI